MQQAAYRQEARWLGVKHFPPLDRTVQDVQSSGPLAWGAWRDARSLVGAVVVSRLGSEEGLTLDALTVLPSAQRNGIASRLIETLLVACPGEVLHVSTGAANTAAIALYRRFGFEEQARRHVGPEQLELVSLRRLGRMARP